MSEVATSIEIDAPVEEVWRTVMDATRLHDQLDDSANERIRPWFLLGGFGFLLIMLGASLATVTLVTHF